MGSQLRPMDTFNRGLMRSDFTVAAFVQETTLLYDRHHRPHNIRLKACTEITIRRAKTGDGILVHKDILNSHAVENVQLYSVQDIEQRGVF